MKLPCRPLAGRTPGRVVQDAELAEIIASVGSGVRCDLFTGNNAISPPPASPAIVADGVDSFGKCAQGI